MNEKTLSALREVGWFEARNADISIYEAAYKREKIPFFQMTKEFLAQFGDLLIWYQNDLFNRRENLSFYATEASDGWGRFIGIFPFNPIGSCFHDCDLLMNEEGEVWISTPISHPMFFAENGEEAIDMIVNWNKELNEEYAEKIKKQRQKWKNTSGKSS